MQIKPSARGHYLKHHAPLTAVAILLAFAGSFLLLSIGFLAAFAIAAIISAIIIAGGILHSSLNRAHTTLHVSNDEVVYERGILNHHKTKVPIAMITDSTIKRSFMDKLARVSTMLINTSGTTEREIIAEDFDFAEVEKMGDEIHRLIRELHRANPHSHEPKK